MTTRDEAKRTIAIIGGGVSGALTAYHLIQHGVRARVIVIDPRPELGLGLAYSTPSLSHLLNVPAGKISALPKEPDHFLEWLRTNHDPGATPMTFAPRSIFGRYIQSILEDVSSMEQVQASVVDLRQLDGSTVLKLQDGRELRADLVVLATGNFNPAALPGISEDARGKGVYRHNAWAPATYEGLYTTSTVTLIGTGLTAVDVVLRLRELGHRGTITAISRHGVFPHRHRTYTAMTESAIPAGTPPTCLGYLRALRRVIRSGAEWRAAIDSLRVTTNDLWLALPLQEQSRFRRHLQRRWEVVRHRMAPPVADRIEVELHAGTLVIRKGHLAGVDAHEMGAVVTIRTSEDINRFATARVINCTGPGMDYRRVNSPLLNSLFTQGLISAGPLGSGFNCTDSGAMIDADGRVSEMLFNLGPGRLGTLLESIAIPEIRTQAVELAIWIGNHLRQRERCDQVSSKIMAAPPSGAPMETATA